jgi:hypothetical protein
MASVSGSFSRKVVPLPACGLDMDGGLQPVQHALHHVHAHAASGNFGDLFRRAESGPEDEFHSFGFADARRFFGSHNSQFDRFGANLLDIDAASVVADFDHHLIALMKEHAAGSFPAAACPGCAALRRFNAVTDRVAHQMRQRFGDRIENAFVEIGFLARSIPVPLRARIAAPHRAPCAESAGTTDPPAPCGSSSPSAADRSKPAPERPWRRRTCRAADLWDSVCRTRERLLQHRLADDELSHQVEDVIDASCFHAQNIFR